MSRSESTRNSADDFEPSNDGSVVTAEVEHAANAFVAAWLINSDEKIETFLKNLDKLLWDEAYDVLIRLEIYLRASHGQPLEQSEYLERFPDQSQVVRDAFHTEARDLSVSFSTESLKNDTKNSSSIGDSSGFFVAQKTDVIPESIGRYEIDRVLGTGGFGVVCLARDTQLGREVALKFARTSRFRTPQEMESLIDEARTAAKLECPGIVAVHDVVLENDLICIVQQFVDGRDLADELKSGLPSFEQTANWMVDICNAIAVAHSKGFIHRDLKPANILIDKQDKPHITDFGLAIHESYQRRRRGDRSGTPRYMSPELVRGESHRIDGRSDLWSLGVILYQMMTGKKPFSGDSPAEIFDEIKHREPRPPREIRPEIPKELERICLRCLNKPLADRYATARDLAVDLRTWLKDSRIQSSRSGDESISDQLSLVTPKGLRSFDAEDADFFFKLLPGPYARNGIPESIRTWKQRIENTDGEVFDVGVLYGPSGCGKSSFVKAGLIPMLSGFYKTFRIEATAADTELRLFRSLRSTYPEIPRELTLSELFQSLREGVWTNAGDRILIVIDQFEQWLHNRSNYPGSELVEALRHCDGQNVQCLLMVRDDFWLATSRFLKALETELVEGKNAGLVDLFDKPHARRVLQRYGRGYGCVDEKVSKQQEDFIEAAVDQLAEEGRVICVRLSLFAEMFRDKPWTPTALRKVGGISGVGVAFLEETFSSKNSPPENRLHEQAARNVLEALLPESSIDIRGNMRSRQDLLHLSGYANRPSSFSDLLRVLDTKLRLITPTDPEGSGMEAVVDPGSRLDFYQLTHDYLVAPLRIWLHQKRSETAAGRAQLRLDERHATWSRTKEKRFLPALTEYLNVRTFTRKKAWSTGEREMMGKADRHFGIRFAAVAGIVLFAAIAGHFWYGNVQANSLAKRLLGAELSEVPAIVQEMKRRNLSDKVFPIATAADANGDFRKSLNVDIAFSDRDEQRKRLWLRLKNEVDSDEAAIVAKAFRANESEVEESWNWLQEDRSTLNDEKRLRAATALSYWDSEDVRWQYVSYSVVGSMLAQNPIFIDKWFQGMPNVRDDLISGLVRHVSEWQLGNEKQEVKVAISLIAEHQSSWPEFDAYMSSEMTRLDYTKQLGSDPSVDIKQFESFTQQQANLATIWLLLGKPQPVLDQMSLPANDRLRALVIKQAFGFNVPLNLLYQCLETEQRALTRSALWLAIGNYAQQETELTEKLLELAKVDYQSSSNAKIHNATEWFIRRSGQEEWITKQTEAAAILIAAKPVDSRREYAEDHDWRTTSQQHTMIRLPPPGRVPMSYERTANIDYGFEVSSCEVTIEQFLRFNSNKVVKPGIERLFAKAKNPLEHSRQRPVANIDWFQAAEYCNWLSEMEGIPKEHWCYEVDPDPSQGYEQYEKPGLGMEGKPVLRLVADFRSRRGFRMPLESEWEWLVSPVWNEKFHSRTFQILLAEYECFGGITDSTLPVGSLKPGQFGLFDVFANAREFCSDSYVHFDPEGSPDLFVENDAGYRDPIELSKQHPDLWRSGSYKLSRGMSAFRSILSDHRDTNVANSSNDHLGFRVVRSLQNEE